jgi:hypothetical protein
MLRRVRVYLTGFAIGLVLVYFMFGRDDSRDLDIWTPEQRILEDIRLDSIFMHSEKLACFQACLTMNDSVLMSLFTDSENKSLNPGGNPYRYLVYLKTDDLHLEAEVEKDTNKQHTLIRMRDLQHPTDCHCE